MGLETATYITGLVETNPLANDFIREADDHMRLIKSVLKNTFPNANAAINATPAELNLLVGQTSFPGVAGVNQQVQFNSAGNFAGSSNMLFDGTRLTVRELRSNGATLIRNLSGTTFLDVDADGSSNTEIRFMDNGVREARIAYDQAANTFRFQLYNKGGASPINSLLLSSTGITLNDTIINPDTNINFGIDDASTFVIRKAGTSGAIQLASGTVLDDGAHITAYGPGHATRADDMDFASGGDDNWMSWDDSAGTITLNTGIGASKTFTALFEPTQVTFGNYVFDTDQALGVGQDDYILTYDNTSGTIRFEPNAGGGGGSVPVGTTVNSTLRWGGAAWLEETQFLIDVNGNIAAMGSQGDIEIQNNIANTILFNTAASDVILRAQVSGSNGYRISMGTNFNITDAQNSDIVLFYTKNADLALYHNDVEMARTASAASGGFEVNNTVTGAGFERVLTTSDLAGGGGDVFKVGTPVDGQLGVWTGDGTIEGDPDLTYDTSNGVLQLTNASIFVDAGEGYFFNGDGDQDNYFAEDALDVVSLYLGGNEVYRLGITDFEFLGDTVVVGDGTTGEKAYEIDVDTAFVRFGGGASGGGAKAYFWGGTHATKANDFELRAGVNNFLTWDESVGQMQILTGSGAKTAALTINSSQVVTIANGNLVTNNIIPGANDTNDIGTTGLAYRRAYLTDYLRIDDTSPQIRMQQTDGGVDQKWWFFQAAGEGFEGRIYDDAVSNNYQFLNIERSGTGASVQVDTIDFSSETSIGFNTPDVIIAGDLAVNGATNANITVNGGSSSSVSMILSGGTPEVRFYEEDAGTDQQRWYLRAAVESFRGTIYSDDFINTYDWMQVERSGTGAAVQADTIDFTAETHIGLGNFLFDITQTVGAGQDNFVLTYDDASGLIGLEAAAGGGSNTTNLGEAAMTTASTFDHTGWPDNVEWFEIHFWDVDMSSSANDITLRLYQGSASLVTSGYDSQTCHIDSAGNRTFANDTAHFEIPGFDGLGTVRGFYKGRRLSQSTDRWAVEGMFFDDDNDEMVHIHGFIDLTSDIDGVRIQSANASNFTDGNYAISYGV